MKRLLGLAAGVLLSLTASAWGGGLVIGPFCWNKGIHCIAPPCPPCPDCSCPCDKRLSLTLCKPEHAYRLMEQLHRSDCCGRIKAARSLGSRLHADFCRTPDVLTALIHALMCDSCWEVRRAAAWSLMLQDARVEPAIVGLYLASKLDPHYLVRDRANEALTILILCRRDCYKDLFAALDKQLKELRPKYKPGSGECLSIAQECYGGLALLHPAPAPAATPAGK